LPPPPAGSRQRREKLECPKGYRRFESSRFRFYLLFTRQFVDIPQEAGDSNWPDAARDGRNVADNRRGGSKIHVS